ncbi:hypothetical protein LB543_27690 [Mesorhizobium sp. ESP7-2]|uniref:hypothetical protein n=1 Tax=Mesorhizobium sp. ESP7-2 TaxID=2876622 RepID=UPI001CCCD03A|nr:hypothetical protein [Mesorhizobium sp. ESP7-2]MBZ9710486.1 hypothetical protein [Mesorhizobium sp. ESP7-2]
MGVRGRKSSAALSVVIGSAGIAAVGRPKPLAILTKEQAEVWSTIVNRLPANWFPAETHGLLAQYCRHTVAADRIATLIGNVDRAKEVNVAEYVELLRAQERESRCIASLATRMRLSQQSTLDKSKKKPAGDGTGGRKLWEA